MTILYKKYDNVRLHGSIADLSPRVFWDIWEQGNISLEVMKEGQQDIFDATSELYKQCWEEV